MAAKRVRISDDGGSNFFTLPGGTGEFSHEAGDIDDTIFGQDYKSSETGLIKWTVTADAFYKGFAGYVADVKKPGTSTVMTAEPMSLEAGQIYQITAASKQIINRAVVPVVFDNAVDETANVEWIDYLFGRVKFLDAYSVNTPVTITGEYYPMVSIGKANQLTLTQTAESVETSDFETVQANGGFRTFIGGLKTVNIELTGIYDVANAFAADLAARNEVLVEINPDGLGRSTARGFFKFAGQAQSGDVGALEEERVSLRLNVPDDPLLLVPFKWVHSGTTTLSESVQKLLAAWEAGSVIDVEYLEDGTNGLTGKCVVTEMSMNTGIEDMNKFSVQLMGTAETTVVS